MFDKRVNNSLQLGYVRRYTLSEGKENGLKVVELNNGILRVLLNESKALDVMQIWYKGVNMSFVSKNGFTVRELPFIKRFEGGMIYTCGLDSIGGRDGFELHGSLHNTPSKVVEVIQNDDKLQVKAIVENTALFGENLALQRTITLLVNDNKFLLEDKLINMGVRTENYCLLYHINFGYPMLDEGVEIVADLSSVTPRSEHSEEKVLSRPVFEPPIDNEEERCYFLDNNSDCVSVVNKKIGKKATISYSKDTLPCLIQWNSPASHDYALGLEPSTSFLDDKFSYKEIEPNNEVDFAVQICFDEI